MSALTAGIDRARQELAANPRLRAGVWAIVAILLLYWLLAQADRRADAGRAHDAAAAELASAESVLSRQDDWPRLRDEAKRGFDAFAEEFWTAGTIGQAQAELEGAVNGMLEGLDLRERDIQSSRGERVAGVPDLFRVPLSLRFGYTEGAERKVLHAIASHPRKLVVESLQIDPRRQRGMLTLLVSAYFFIGDATASRNPPS